MAHLYNITQQVLLDSASLACISSDIASRRPAVYVSAAFFLESSDCLSAIEHLSTSHRQSCRMLFRDASITDSVLRHNTLPLITCSFAVPLPTKQCCLSAYFLSIASLRHHGRSGHWDLHFSGYRIQLFTSSQVVVPCCSTDPGTCLQDTVHMYFEHLRFPAFP